MKNYELVEINYLAGSELGKTNLLLNLVKHQRPDTNKIYFYVK